MRWRWSGDVPAESGFTAGSAFEGVLGISDTNCLGYEGDGVVVPVIFPFGTTVLSSDDGVTLPSGRTISIGDPLVGGGGAVAQAGLKGVTIPKACSGEEAVGIHLD